jgi:hypothetical protein
VTHERTGWAQPLRGRVYHYFVNHRSVCRARHWSSGPFLTTKPGDHCCHACAVVTLKQILARMERS